MVCISKLNRTLLSASLLLSVAAFAQTERKPPVYTPARLLSATYATYPDMTVARGTVVFAAVVNRSGEVEDARVVQDIPPLTQAAEASLRQWQFAPAAIDDSPVKTTVTVAFTFAPGPVPTGPGFTGPQPGSPPPADQSFSPAQITASTEPDYPFTLVSGGTVVLQIHLSKSGEMQAVKTIREVPGLTTYALKSLKKWSFKPAMLDGAPANDIVFAAFVFYRNAVYQPQTTRPSRSK